MFVYGEEVDVKKPVNEFRKMCERLKLKVNAGNSTDMLSIAQYRHLRNAPPKLSPLSHSKPNFFIHSILLLYI